ncbi:MAG TPA: hypothetical protein VKW76_04530 [Candidatus Binatia bacterium]|nr:hypothetical protein [Candidatus Binatia bacterium]
MRSTARAVVWTAVLVLALGARPARGGENDEMCLACHGVEGVTAPDGRSLFVGAAAYGASEHAGLDCTSCHAGVSGPHEEPPAHLGPQVCAACHRDVVSIYDRSVHGRARAAGGTDAATCTSCHGSPHAVAKVTDPTSPVYPLNLPRTCGVCHGDRALAERHGIPVADAYQLYMDSIHGRAVSRGGLLVAANCSSCHGAHDILPANDPDSKVFRTNIPATCGRCHAGVENAYLQGSHGDALHAGRRDAPVCIDCHGAHRIQNVTAPGWQVATVSECGSCHTESRATFRDSFHGQITGLGFTVVARCPDCHEAHRVLPASDPRSSIAPAHLVDTCRKCHPAANVNFVAYRPHADVRDRARNPGLWAVALSMRMLLVGVFVFFGVHTVLWLLRSLRESRGRR